MNTLFAANTPAAFWQPLASVPTPVWDEATAAAADLLPPGLAATPPAHIISDALSERLFGDERYTLSRLKSIYYAVARPLLPAWVRPLLRKVYHPAEAEGEALLHWPLEDRYVRFQFALIAAVMERLGRDTLDITGLWPDGHGHAFVLTHDVEARAGHDFVPRVMALEEKYGFRSSFNFVPEGYRVDPGLLADMRARGHEIGVHGLKHDGRLFASREVFEQRARQINAYAAEWGAVGYRSPMTHRQPEWMQSLAIDYDLSFFDTDPYEPMAGGVMSIWPFMIGRFVELPYTLMQDHRYLEVLNQRSPDLWLEKVDFIIAHAGMALLNSHPDYLLKPGGMAVYEALLAAMQARGGWAALPRDVAGWWRRRSAGAPGAVVWRLVRDGRGVRIQLPQPVAAAHVAYGSAP